MSGKTGEAGSFIGTRAIPDDARGDNGGCFWAGRSLVILVRKLAFKEPVVPWDRYTWCVYFMSY